MLQSYQTYYDIIERDVKRSKKEKESIHRRFKMLKTRFFLKHFKHFLTILNMLHRQLSFNCSRIVFFEKQLVNISQNSFTLRFYNQYLLGKYKEHIMLSSVICDINGDPKGMKLLEVSKLGGGFCLSEKESSSLKNATCRKHFG